MVFFQPKSWWEDDIYWFLKRSCFEVSGYGKYRLFLSQKLMERWYLLGLFVLSMIFQCLGCMIFRAAFSKYAWVVPLKDKKGINFVNAFQRILDSSKIKPSKIWIDQGVDFYNNFFKKFLKENTIEIYSTYNEGKSVVAERFIKTLKKKIFKHMTAVLKNVYFDVLDDIVDNYNNTF